jgi:hypothetical protein
MHVGKQAATRNQVISADDQQHTFIRFLSHDPCLALLHRGHNQVVKQAARAMLASHP